MPKAWWDTISVAEFREAAQRYIALLDERDMYSSTELLQHVHAALPQLYSCGLALPKKPASTYVAEVDDSTVDSIEPEASLHEQFWPPLFGGLTSKIGPARDYYRTVLDPYDAANQEVVVGSLADDLSDIYVELRMGEYFLSRRLYDEAVWQWRFGFESHWGEHATGALRAIRSLAAIHDLGFMRDGVTD